MKNPTKAELHDMLTEREGRISDLEDELRRTNRELASITRDRDEHRQFNHNAKRDLDLFDDFVHDVVKIHTPYFDPSDLRRGANRDGREFGVTVRCKVCRTPEHHTWGPDNHEVWPCPTVEPLIKLRMPIEVIEELAYRAVAEQTVPDEAREGFRNLQEAVQRQAEAAQAKLQEMQDKLNAGKTIPGDEFSDTLKAAFGK